MIESSHSKGKTMLAISERIGKIFDRVSFRKQEEAESVFGPYRELLDALLAGDEIDFDAVEITLERLGKTRSDLERDCEILSQRREWHQQLCDRPQKQAEIERHSAEMLRIEAEYKAMATKYLAEIQAHRQAAAAAELAISQGMHAERNLLQREHIIDPLVLGKLKAIEARRSEVGSRFQDAREELREATRDYEAARRTVEGMEATKADPKKHRAINFWPGQFDAEKYATEKRKADHFKIRFDRATAELERLQSELRQIDRDQQQAIQEALKP